MYINRLYNKYTQYCEFQNQHHNKQNKTASVLLKTPTETDQTA